MERRRSRAAIALDRLLSRRTVGVVDLGRLLDQVVPLSQLSSDVVCYAATSLPTIGVDAERARAVAVAVRELVHAFECAGWPDEPVRVYVAGEWDGVDLTLALACPEAADRPVPTAAGLASIVRADMLATLDGGTLVRGVRDGRALFGLAFRWDG